MGEEERLLQWIEAEAGKQMDNIKKQGEERISELRKRHQEQLDLEKKKIEEFYRKKAEQERARIISSARVESRRIIAQVKAEVIERAFENALTQLYSLVKEQSAAYTKFIEKMLAQAVNILGGDDIIIYINQRDYQLLEKIKTGLDIETHIILKTDDNIAGGFVAYSKDKKLRFNATIESIFQNEKDRLRKEVSGILFSR